jgi:DNA-binding CsgD family transcriptional regulator
MLSRSDEIDLLTVLHEGLHEDPRWSTFLARMQRRTGADHVSLIVGQGDVPIHRATQWFAGRDMRAQAEQFADLAALDPTPYHRLRPGRVYSATELIDPQDANHSRFQRDYLNPLGVRFGRFMRVAEPGGRSAWLTVTRAAHDFTAADSALLSSLAPHLSIALRTLGELERARFHVTVSDDALARAGIGWAAVDGKARPLDGSGKPVPLATAQRALAIFAAGPPAALRVDGERPFDLIALDPPDQPLAAPEMPAAVLLWRSPPALGTHSADMLMRLFGLSRGEARLAVRLAQGERLVDAAGALGLTIETARNYSKRLFVKTDTHGQTDLVRLILNSVASLA